MNSRFIHPLFSGGLRKAFTLSYDDGVTQDERLIALFDKYHVKATFNINSGQFGVSGAANNQPYPATHIRFPRERILSMYQNHEIANHGYQHLDLTAYPLSTAAADVIQDRVHLEDLLHHPVTGMAYAFGTYNTEIVELLRTLGIHYCRTVKSTHSFDLPEEFLTWHPTCHHNDPQLLPLLKDFVERDDTQAQLFYLWGHSYEFDGHRNWDRMEEALSIVSGHNDIWYATNGEIYRYIKAFDQLIVSADGHLIENPSSFDLWLWVSSQAVKLPAGEITVIDR